MACSENKDNKSEEQPDMHTSQIALDWNGVYTGTLPCADCEGILKEIQLYEDQNYAYRSVYLGKSKEIISSFGSFEWNEDGNTISLLDDNNRKTYYHVGENKLFLLDEEGNRIEGDLAAHYTLNKVTSPSLSSIFFKLERLHGQPVPFLENQNEEIHFRADTVEMKIYGHSGCNTFRGSFRLEGDNNIQFSQMATTMMACDEEIMDQEQTILSVFEQTTNYLAQSDSVMYYDENNNELALFVGLRMFE